MKQTYVFPFFERICHCAQLLYVSSVDTVPGNAITALSHFLFCHLVSCSNLYQQTGSPSTVSLVLILVSFRFTPHPRFPSDFYLDKCLVGI